MGTGTQRVGNLNVHLRDMSQWIGRLSVTALLWAAALSPAAAQQQPQADPAAGSVEYSLLTPAIAGKYVVVTVVDLMSSFALGGHTNTVREASLRELVDKEGYDASSSLAIALKEELEAAGYRTEVEPVPRARPGQPQRLTRADLPTSPHGQFLLDVVIDWIGLANASNGAEWLPAFKLTWRVMRPSGEIVVPSHAFWHGPSADPNGIGHSQTSCGLPNFNETMKQPQVLWDCFDRGLREASRVLVPLIREKQDVALHGKPASGGTAKPKPDCEKPRRPRDVLAEGCNAE